MGAALENIIPPVPADTFVLLGAFLAGRGGAGPVPAFLSVWIFNVGGALVVYGVARRHDAAIRRSRLARWLLDPGQLRQVDDFYRRWGAPAIFVSRFLPAFRAVVPVFAGLSEVGLWRMALPTAVASGLWYGTLIYLGITAGDHWEAVRAAVGRVNTGLLLVAVALLAAVGVWWWRGRTRRRRG